MNLKTLKLASRLYSPWPSLKGGEPGQNRKISLLKGIEGIETIIYKHVLRSLFPFNSLHRLTPLAEIERHGKLSFGIFQPSLLTG